GAAGTAAEEGLDGNLLLSRACAQRVGAGKIRELDLAPVREGHRGGAAIDGDAGIVGHARPRAREGVEQRGLAGIWVAGHHDEGWAGAKAVRTHGKATSISFD